MYDWLIIFIVGWFGSVWWPGIEIDAPPPGGGGDPWWTRLALGVVGGLAAVLLARMVGAGMDAMVGIVVSIAVGRVAAGIVAPFFRMARR